MPNDLGNPIRKIELTPNFILVIVALAILVAVVSGIMLLTGKSEMAAYVTGFGSVVVVFTIAAAVFNWLFTSLIRVTVHDNGIALHYKTQQKAVLWDDVVAVQSNNFTETRFTPERRISPLVFLSPIRMTFAVFFKIIDPGGKAYTYSSSYYVFHLKDGSQYTLSGDVRLFELQEQIQDKVMPLLTPKVRSEFEKGSAQPLATGLNYSNKGIKGVFERKAGRAHLKTPVDLEWSGIKRVDRMENTMRIEANGITPIVLPFAEIRNMPIFVAIIKDMSSQHHFKQTGF